MIKRHMGRTLAVLLVLSAVLLGILVPGGPIETRSFSHISPFILGAFNTFLTVLGIGSLVLAYCAFKGKRWAILAAAFCGISYFLVYALDLGMIFPVSSDKMPPALFGIEVASLLVSFPLTFLSLRGVSMPVINSESPENQVALKKSHVLLLVLMTLAGVGIIIFATMSAMGK